MNGHCTPPSGICRRQSSSGISRRRTRRSPLRGSFPYEFPRHQEIYKSDGGASIEARAPAHRLDEFPSGYSLVSTIARLRFTSRFRVCSKPASAVDGFPSNGEVCLNYLSQPRGQAHADPLLCLRHPLLQGERACNASRLSSAGLCWSKQ